MVIRAVLDTNVLLAGARGLTRKASTPGTLLRQLYAGTFVLVTSQHILTELAKGIQHPYFRKNLTAYEVEQIRQFLEDEADFTTTIEPIQGVAIHAADDLVLATAVSGNAEYLVTGDKGLLGIGSYRGVTIVTPRAFLDILETATPPSAP